MKKLLKPLALLFCVGFIASCAKNKAVTIPSDAVIKNPVSDFTVAPDAQDGFTFNFSSLSENYTKLEWRFGDDTLKTDSVLSHTYLATGQYTVDLETYSKTGATSHKQVLISIVPDSIIKVSAAKTGTDGQLKFTADVKAKVKSIKWTFNIVDPSTSKSTPDTTSELTPSITFPFGSFNNFSVTVTTDKGSVATISRNVTTDGIVTDITPSHTYYFSSNENLVQGPNEGSLKLVDGDTNTKFGYYAAFPVPEIAVLGFAVPQTVKLYAIENGNDSESTRDPKEWYIEGSNNKDDDSSWQVLDHQLLTVGFADYLSSIGQNSTRYLRFFYYPIANPKPYTYYRWRIVSTFASAFQIEELRFYR